MAPWAILTGFSFLFFIRLSWRYPVLFPIPTVFWEEGVTALSSRSVWQRFTRLLKGWKSGHVRGSVSACCFRASILVTFDDILLLFAFGGAYCLSGFLRESPNAKDSVCEWNWLWSSCSGNDAVVSCHLRCAGGVAMCSKYHHTLPVPAPQILLQPSVFTETMYTGNTEFGVFLISVCKSR